jgi:hypothetical protein
MKKRATDTVGKEEPLAQTHLRQFVGYEMKLAYLLIQQDMMRILKPTGLRIVTFQHSALLSRTRTSHRPSWLRHCRSSGPALSSLLMSWKTPT